MNKSQYIINLFNKNSSNLSSVLNWLEIEKYLSDRNNQIARLTIVIKRSMN